MRWLKRWKLRRLRRELAALEVHNFNVHCEPGHTTAQLSDRMLLLGHHIAMRRFEIKELEDDLCES